MGTTTENAAEAWVRGHAGRVVPMPRKVTIGDIRPGYVTPPNGLDDVPKQHPTDRKAAV